MNDTETIESPDGTPVERGGSLAPGDRFGEYEVVRPLGEGAYGAVYECVKHPLKKRVAVKVLHPQHAQREEVVGRFVREAEVVAQIEHPHIVDVFDVGVCAGRPFLAMEFLEGEALSAALRREGRLGVAPAVDLLLAVMSAVATVHERGVIHRDLKPDNIFLARTASGAAHPKLLDFGIAKVSEAESSLTRTNAMLGTPMYMSPEQAQESKRIGPASDQWALGVILFECLAGERPFRGDSLLRLLNAITLDEAPDARTFAPDVPAPLAAAIQRALAKHPERRWPSVRAFGAAILPCASPAARAQWEPIFPRGDDAAAEATSNTLPSPAPSAPPPVQPPSAPDLTGTLDPSTRPPLPSSRRSRGALVAMVAAACTAVFVVLGVAATRRPSLPRVEAARAVVPAIVQTVTTLTPRAEPPAAVVASPPAPPVPVAPAEEPPAATAARGGHARRAPRARPAARPATRPATRPAAAPADCPNGICPVD